MNLTIQLENARRIVFVGGFFVLLHACRFLTGTWKTFNRATCSRIGLYKSLCLTLIEMSSLHYATTHRMHSLKNPPLKRWQRELTRKSPMSGAFELSPACSSLRALAMEGTRRLALIWRLEERRYGDFRTLFALACWWKTIQLALFRHATLRIIHGFGFEVHKMRLVGWPRCWNRSDGVLVHSMKRFICNQQIQMPDESIDSFLFSLRSLIQPCNFCGYLEEALRTTELWQIKRVLKILMITLQRRTDICEAKKRMVNVWKPSESQKCVVCTK